MDLDRNARISDASGSTTADHIQMQQTTGDFDASGHVSTTRLPESNKSESAMLDKDEPTLGTADRVTSANRNHLIHYAGKRRGLADFEPYSGRPHRYRPGQEILVADGQGDHRV